MHHAKSTRIRARKSRSFRPTVLDLEARELMSGVAYVISTTGPPVIGEHFHLIAVDKDGLPYAPGVVKSITWTIPGAYSIDTSADPNAQGGFDYKPFGTVTTNGTSVDGYWDGSSGPHSITDVIQYVQPTVEGVPIPVIWPDTYTSSVNVNGINPYMKVINSGITAVRNGQLVTATLGGPGFQVQAGADVTGLGVTGTIGIIQTVRMNISRTDSQGKWQDGLFTTSGPYAGRMFATPQFLLDWDANFTKYPYYGTFPTSQVGPTTPRNTIVLTDSPSSVIDQRSGLFYQRSDEFTDTLMFQPEGGIPVAVGSMAWSWSGMVDNRVLGRPKLAGTKNMNPKILRPFKTDESARTMPTWTDITTNGWLEDNWTLIAPAPQPPPQPPPTTTIKGTYTLPTDTNPLTSTQTSTLTSTQTSTLTPTQDQPTLTSTQTSTLTPTQSSTFVLSSDSAAIASQNVLYVPPPLAYIELGIDLLASPNPDWAKFTAETGLTYHDIVDATYPGKNYLPSADVTTTQPVYADWGYVDYSSYWNDYLSYYVDYKGSYADYSLI